MAPIGVEVAGKYSPADPEVEWAARAYSGSTGKPSPVEVDVACNLGMSWSCTEVGGIVVESCGL